MDIRDISRIAIAENCARTNLGVAENIDGVAVTGVQIWAPKNDTGANAGSYIGNGEVLITDEQGRSLDASTAVKAIPAIVFHQRSLDGNHHYQSNAIKGRDIKSYEFTAYAAPVEEVGLVHTIDATLVEYTYVVKLRRRVSSKMHVTNGQEVRTITFKTGTTASTAQTIIDGLVTAANLQLNEDALFPIIATRTSSGATSALTLTGQPLNWELGKYEYDQLKFTIESVNFTSTVVTNELALIAVGADPAGVGYAQATRGAGNYEQVADAEFHAIMFTGANIDKLSPVFQRRLVSYDAQKFEDDKTTANRYDTLVINWEHFEGAWSANVSQEGSMIIYLPLDDNTTNQQDDILDTLNKYIVTEWGVGTTKVLS